MAMDIDRDFIGIEPWNVDAIITRIKELNDAGVLDGTEADEMLWEGLSMRIMHAGGDHEDFIAKLDKLLG